MSTIIERCLRFEYSSLPITEIDIFPYLLNPIMDGIKSEENQSRKDFKHMVGPAIYGLRRWKKT